MKKFIILFFILFGFSFITNAQLTSDSQVAHDQINSENSNYITLNPALRVKFSYILGSGSILYNDDGLKELVAGSLGQVLTQGAAFPFWADAPITSPLTLIGQIIQHDGANDIAVNPGTAGQLWTSNGIGSLASYQDPPVAVSVTTEGDLQGHDGVNPIRIAGGVNGDFPIYDDTIAGNIGWGSSLQGNLNPTTNPIDITSITSQGFGVTTGAEFQYYRDGAFLIYSGRFTTGTVAAIEAQITLPEGLAISSSVPSGGNVVGTYGRATSGTNKGGFILATAGDSFINFTGFVFGSSAASSTTPTNGSSIFNSASVQTLEFAVRIEGWLSGVDAVAQNRVPLKVVAENTSSQSIPHNTATVISYVETIDNKSAFASNTLTVPYDMRILICPRIQFTSAAWVQGDAREMKITRSTSGDIGISREEQQSNNTEPPNVGGCAVIDVVSGETVTVTIFQNNGSAILLNSSATVNHLTIDEVPSSFTIAAAIDSQRWDCSDRNHLLTDISSVGVAADLTFTGMTIGGKYVIRGQFFGNSDSQIQIRHNASTIIARWKGGGVATNAISSFTTGCFTATDTFVDHNSVTTNTIFGNGTNSESWSELCVAPDNYICN